MFEVEQLGGSTRSNVRRLHVGGSVIVKEHTEEGDAWARESAALSVLPPGAPAPRLVAAGGKVIVMEDVGRGPSVADALLGADPADAEAALHAWAEALADLHRLTADRGDAFAEALAARAPQAEPSTMTADLAEAAATIERHCGELGLTLPPGALDELRGLAKRGLGESSQRVNGQHEGGQRVNGQREGGQREGGQREGGQREGGQREGGQGEGGQGEGGQGEGGQGEGEGAGVGGGHCAMTPADTCPDNNIRTERGVVLIDFEWAEWRPVAWDVAYLSVPWPSCWCAWRVPADVLARATDTYRARLGWPYADTAEFRADVAAAAAGWAFITAGWFLHRALADDPPMTPPSRPAPSRRALVLHRLAQARETPDLPNLAELADRLHAALIERWHDAPLAYAPAFRHGVTTP